jgi:anthranilate phosphoribosyltransferase
LRGEELIRPEDFGFTSIDHQTLKGGHDTRENASIFLDILQNRASTGQKQVVVANAALAIRTISGFSLEACVSMADEALSSGKAFETFKKLIQIQS